MKKKCSWLFAFILFGAISLTWTNHVAYGVDGLVTVSEEAIFKLRNSQTSFSFPFGLKFRLHDKDGDLASVVTNIRIVETSLKKTMLEANFSGLDVKLEIQLKDEGTHFSLIGVLRGMSDKERALDLYLVTPLTSPHGWRLWKNWRDFESLPASATSDVLDEDAVFPILCVDNRQSEQGFVIAAHPKYPVRFLAGCSGYDAWVRLALGLSPANRTPDAAEFQLVIFPYDGKGGFRTAVAVYYSLFPEIFSNKFAKLGGWYVAPLDMVDLNLQRLAFHEVGLGLFMKQGLSPKVTKVSEYTQICGLKADIKAGNYFFPYLIPGQRQIYPIQGKVRSGEEAESILQAWNSNEPILFENLVNATSFGSSQELKQIVLNGSMRDRNGSLIFVNQRVTKRKIPALIFPQNADPDLFHDTDRLTIAKYMESYVDLFLKEAPSIAGFYVDSLGIWGRFYNHRSDHRRYANFAPTYDPKSGGIALPSQYSMAEFLWHMREKLCSQGKYLFGNGLRPNRAFCSFPCDVLGLEMKTIDAFPAAFYSPRIFAGRKPVLILAKGSVGDAFFQKALFFGYIVSGGSPVASLFTKYSPAMIEVAQAGWEPQLDAISGDPAVWVEKWESSDMTGSRYYTIMNTEKRPVETTLAFPGRPGESLQTIRSLIDGSTVVFEVTSESWTIARLSLLAEEVVVYRLKFKH